MLWAIEKGWRRGGSPISTKLVNLHDISVPHSLGSTIATMPLFHRYYAPQWSHATLGPPRHPNFVFYLF